MCAQPVSRQYTTIWGVERDQISDIRPPKKSNIRYLTPKKIKYQISHPLKNQISDIKVPPPPPPNMVIKLTLGWWRLAP